MFFSSKTRICASCKQDKALNHDFYHSDVKGLAGFAARCKDCRNKARRKVEPTPKPIPSVSVEKHTKAHQKVKIPIVSDNILDALNKKFDATYTVTVQRNGKTYLQVHSKPFGVSYRFQKPEELMEIA
jgi:hypothetical protein